MDTQSYLSKVLMKNAELEPSRAQWVDFLIKCDLLVNMQELYGTFFFGISPLTVTLNIIFIEK